jgi:ubiquinone/menaquinone biosynthesis C-methylase UbiE
MPLPALNDRQYLEKQYKDSSNLDARIRLHQRFSVNPYGWHPWVFDHLDLPPHARILELGCGPGYLWQENLARIPTGCEILLSDFSAGMLEQARRNLAAHYPFQFRVIDAQAIPLGDATFDVVIANHMLYHVPDRPAALAEIQRILKPSGRFYASTGGARHMFEIRDLIIKFDTRLSAWGLGGAPFTLENGMAQLLPWFTEIMLHRYKDALEVTEAAPLVDYILSGWAKQILSGRQAEFGEFIARALESCGGVFHISEDAGLFVSVKKGE